MADESTLHRDVQRGQRAELLRNDPLVQEAFAALETAYTEAWRNSKALDSAGREKLWQAVQIVGLVQAHFGKVLNDGAVARRDLDDLAKLGERRKLFGVV